MKIKPKPNKISPIPSIRYTSEYFMEHSDGYQEFQSTKGRKLPSRLKSALDMAEITPGMVVLDIGCGRGEILFHAYQLGASTWGLDYSEAAINITLESLRNLIPNMLENPIQLQMANATHLPYDEGSFDIVFLLDIVEHLNPDELKETLIAISRVLKGEGMLIIHTMPNLWYYRFGYPLYRAFQRIRGVKLPKDPRDRWGFKDVHVNEQTPRTLKHNLKNCGFEVKINTTSVMTYPHEKNHAIRKAMIFLSRAPLLRWVLGNDIFALARKNR